MIKVDGIYDKRSLIHLKNLGVQNFGFDFNPRSLNFIQYHIFQEQILPLLSPEDRIFLHFSNDLDPMIEMLHSDLSITANSSPKFFFEIDRIELISQLQIMNVISDIRIKNASNAAGFFADYEFLDELNHKKLLSIFFSKLFSLDLSNKPFIVLRNYNLAPIDQSVTDYLENYIVAISIDRSFEVCYRNVNLRKLTERIGRLMDGVIT